MLEVGKFDQGDIYTGHAWIFRQIGMVNESSSGILRYTQYHALKGYGRINMTEDTSGIFKPDAKT